MPGVPAIVRTAAAPGRVFHTPKAVLPDCRAARRGVIIGIFAVRLLQASRYSSVYVVCSVHGYTQLDTGNSSGNGSRRPSISWSSRYT